MRTMATRLAIAAFCPLLASCGAQDNDPGPGGVTIGEARALDEAAEMIEQGRPSPELLKQIAPTQEPPPAE
ncbi:hypothetical protein U8326_14865 [Tsuneonella sp. CC-YZS046]|uniref:hypothetical protein n=1 Tax=Tsuneonella sp. CC-YZS046 TaxID=3042152 RepID=UPI002D77B421|nr:hypothetical protein [Tsuneonella sp. CC-YZS046]WRO66299.1 hypothetical protein U8326_14865 [Tsuneonella sp. CC-YZS046]